MSLSKHDDASTTHSGTAALASSSPSEATTSSQERNGTSSVSYSWSVTVPFSATGNTDSKDVTHSVTPTITPPPTLTPTMSFSYGTLTDESTLTTSLTSTTSHSSSVTVSEDESHTVQSLSLSPPTHSSTTSDSSAPSTSSSPSLTGATFTNEHSDSRGSASMSLSQHLSFSQTVSPQPTQMSISLSTTITELLTLSIPPPTSTHIPTPTDTLLTSCPDCVHGTCTDIAPFICQCFLSYSLGFWSGGEVQGATCVDCVANFYGPSCKSSCPGGVCTPCNNHGICDDGVSGTGSCTCFANSTEGMWTGTSCDTCMSGYYGAECKGVCACVTNAGTCSDGISGDGSCTCASGRSGTQCESCTSGFYLLPSNSSSTNSSSSSSTCAECPGYSTTTGACFGNGACDPSTGICYCTGLYTQASNCEATDPDAVNGCNASCTQNNGTCLYDVCTCPTGSLGVNCEAQCPMTYTTTTTTVVTNNTNSTNGTTTNLTTTITTIVVSSICGNHGSCFYDANTSTANCSCDANTTVGFYDVLTNCSTCLQGYGGDKCDTACPVHSTGGGICNYLNIAGGTIAGLCNSTSGECNCPLGYCGYDCTLSTRADGQCICNATTLFGPECNTTCVNGTTINWQNTSGRCICNTNFVGTSCDVECGCQSSTAGTCPYDNSTCVCVAGRAGSTCSIICPKNSVTGTTCSNHGYCQDGNTGNGQCVCTSAYVGEACQTPCQCVNSSLGSCQSDGKCVCDSSTWRTGDDCASCQSGRCGDNCRTQCVNGTTSGTECICQATFGGVGCDQQCPTSPTNNLLCSGNGNCSEGNLGTGKCVCVSGYVGPYCNCTDAGCVASRGANSVCNATTGTCSCVLPYGGSDCSTCATGYWGYSCMNVCPCVHGTCNRISGSCTCDADEQNGFWTGTLCNACVSGYNLPDCIQAVAVSTQIGSYQSIYLKGVLYYSAKKLLVLEEYDVAVAIGPVTAVYQNISQSIPTLMQQVNFASQIAFSSTACTYGYAWVAPQSPTTEEASSSGTTTTSTTTMTTTTTPSVYIAQLCALSSNNTYDTVVIQEYPLLPLSNFFSSAQLNASKRSNATFNVTVPQLEALVAMKYFTYQGSDYLAAAVTVIVSGNSVNALYSINFDASARVLTRQFASTPLASNLDATISTVDAVDYDPIRQRVIVVGTYDATGVSTATQDLAGVYVLTFPPNEADFNRRRS
ncbi:Hypothetical protein, putative [Bodo saltans]|uniref:EGF-like domain-containing protein n=1 Tax=Bodo saltans TaxID=75058 RepID=A0A0S4IVE3_BODSA|nr:Hypothetical protein, putative [Bodo saltans]|eukprot:CUG02664.1 Hypothetical protein, putative [Bodo saltans]